MLQRIEYQILKFLIIQTIELIQGLVKDDAFVGPLSATHFFAFIFSAVTTNLREASYLETSD